MTAPLVAVCGAVVALAAAVPLRRWLRTHAYRYDDERDTPLRGHSWVLAGMPVAVFLVMVELASRWPALLAAGYAVSLVPLAALVAIDLDVHRLPDRLTYPMVPIALAVAAIASVATGDWPALLRAVLAGIALLAAYFVLMLLSRGAAGLGFGDVKLAAGLGVLLGWFSWGAVLEGTMAAFLVSGGWAAVLLVTRRATRHTYIAFGPFMAIGTVLALLVV